jgi:hypothetical protein
VILLWGEHTDRPFASVLLELNRAGAPVMVLETADLAEAEVCFGLAGLDDAELRVHDLRIPLAAIGSAYLRPVELSVDTSPHVARLVEALLTWADVAPAVVVNRPEAMAANSSKPFQARQIWAAGFATPETLITSSPEAVRAFCRRGPVIYKSMSGIRSIVSRFGPEQERYLQDVTHCPTMFQECVAGDDYRVHVVGDELFATRIVSSASDYRYASHDGTGPPSMQSVQLPPDVAARIRDMVRTMQLRVAGVDLRWAPGGVWYCFEVNPSPAFSYFAQATGQPIARAIARLLAAQPACVRDERSQEGTFPCV